MNDEMDIMTQLCDSWSVDKTQIVQTGERFFNDSKKLSNIVPKKDR